MTSLVANGIHLMLALASCDTDGIVNGTTAFVTSVDQNEVQQDFYVDVGFSFCLFRCIK